jgi:hypothetical protein
MEPHEVSEPVRLAIMELMMVLYRHGIRAVHTGALMRLVGVSDTEAQECDDERIILTDDFTEYMNQMILLSSVKRENQTLH